MARVSFPLHSVQIKMVVIIEAISSRAQKGSALPYPALCVNKQYLCPIVLAVLDNSCLL